MVYVIVDSQNPNSVILVKAENQEDVGNRLKLQPTEKIAARFSTATFRSLIDSPFAVISQQ